MTEPMPVFSDYEPNFLFKSGHFSTIYPYLFRQVDIKYDRERIKTQDGDFIDLDRSLVGGEYCVILAHGLEGSSQSTYALGSAKAYNAIGWDVIVTNSRGCSGEPNLLYRSYHSGFTEDLGLTIDHVASHYNYKAIVLVGFSMGGNIVLKYGGEVGANLHPNVAGLVAVSAPCDLHAASNKISTTGNILYQKRFMNSLKKKLHQKRQFEECTYSAEELDRATGFLEIDNMYTAPAHGFKDALDYWKTCSSKQFIDNIRQKTLIISAQNDPFYTEECHPVKEAEANENVKLILTKYGGHVGFPLFGEDIYWHEQQIQRFLQQIG
ncbi:YheT family hydrolase [Sediminitomix flava]|uniref:AB hydrolase-1 domain-containing protein n=1 Tax=Sediminitomix flava TaxID=379075 RepID=A0A316A305_SEDFL|nr:alpha/beta fold hydrolase [Sediminitomix flava]PWJ44087.1 hypothetical protein BC781_101437 [Sediminitomix flava]